MPTVSVIVPNYNHARFLRQRIDSILAQTYQDFELILLDDCSTDDSRTILREYASHPRVAHIEFSDSNSGNTYTQWNKGVRLARGEYVWIAESDDYAAAPLLERLVACLDASPSVTLAYCRSWCVDEFGELDQYVDVRLKYDPQKWSSDFCDDGVAACRGYFLRANPIANASATVFRRKIYDEVGGADETLRYCADWKLWAAVVLRGKLAYLAEPLNYYRFHPGSVRSRNSKGLLEITEPLQVLRWIIAHGPLSAEENAAVLDALAASWLPLITDRRTPISVRRAVWQHASALDPQAVRRVARAFGLMARLKVRRHWREMTT